MSERKPWWFSRIGQVGAATVTSVHPEPQYGAAIDLATAPLTDQQYVDLLNDVQTVYEDEEEQTAWDRIKGGIGSGFGWVGDRLSDAGGLVTEHVPYGDKIGAAASAVGSGVMSSVEWYDRNIGQPFKRIISTPQQALNIAEERRTGFFDFKLDEAETWKDAWKRAEFTTLGQGAIEASRNPLFSTELSDPEFRAEAYEQGFDPETAMPRNQAFREIRESDTGYNIGSGFSDFVAAWYLDPLVVGGKAAGVTRALVKGDLDRLPASTQTRIRGILSAPESELATISAQASKLDVVTHRAVALAQQKYALRDAVRDGSISRAQLADYQSFRQSPQGVSAAHLFHEAAVARTADGAFDDDAFDTVTAALLGNVSARDRLVRRYDEVGDAINALERTTIPALDEAVREASERLDDIATSPDLTDLERAEALLVPRLTHERASLDAQQARLTLAEYKGHETFMHAALEEGASLTLAPRAGASVPQRIGGAIASTYRPTGHSAIGHRVLSIPRAVFLQRPGVADLHRADSTFESARRLLDQSTYYSSKTADAVAAEHGFEGWGVLKDTALSRLAGATSDTQRRAVMSEIEDIAIENVAAQHGMTRAEAVAVANHVRGQRARLVSQIVRQSRERAYSSATRPDGKRIDTYTVKHSDGSTETIRLPIDVTQLENTYVATDLRVLNQILRTHGDSIKATLWRGGSKATRPVTAGLDNFNHLWKPAVLLRFGYAQRNILEDTLRVIAVTGNFSHMASTLPYVATGTRNIGTRLKNRMARTRHWLGDRTPSPTPRMGNGPNAVPDSLGQIDAIDKDRLTKIQKATTLAENWSQKSLSNAANGKRPSKAPALLPRLDEAVARGGDTVAIDAVTGKAVSKGSFTQPFEGTVHLQYGAPDAQTLARYIKDQADLLSNSRNVLLVRKVDDVYEISVARRHAKPGAAATEAAKLPLKEVHHIGQDKATLEALKRAGEKPVAVGGQEFSGAFDPNVADVYRPVNSADPFNRSLSRSYEHNLGSLRAGAMERTVVQGEDGFTDAWARVINDRIRKSPIIRRMLDGWDDDQIVRWLNDTPDGRALKRRMAHKSHNPERWVEELRMELDDKLPTERLRQMAREGEITSSDLANLRPGVDPMPASIDHVSIGLSFGDSTLSQKIGIIRDKAFNALATVPQDQLVRHPFFERNYRYHLARQMDTLEEGTEITPRVKASMETQAREYALKQTQRYLFSLADETEFVHMLRFISPFATAWQESLVRWFRALTERPESFARFYVQGWQNMDSLWGVEEYEDEFTGQPTLRLTMPESVTKGLAAVLPGVSSEDLERFETWTVPKQSTNVTLQGQPWWLPGAGPTLQLPAKYILENDPDLADDNAFSKFAWNWLFPIGVPKDAFDAISPAWVRQARRYFAEEEDPVFANLSLLVHKNDLQRWKDGGQVGPKPTMPESYEKAKGIQLFYVAGRLGAPFSFQLESESQFWIDSARQYREQYGHREGLQRFVDDMGDDAYLWWTSLSQSNNRVPPTSEGYEQWQRYQAQVEKHPELGDLIVGLDAADAEFNSAVYQRQQQLPVAPGDPRRQRGQQTAKEALDEVERTQGWQEYRQWRMAIEAELAARGLRSLSQSGAEDLAAMNQAFLTEQFRKLPGWQRDFQSFDQGKIYATVNAMRDLVQSGHAPERPDWAGIEEFLTLHDAFAAELDARSVVGGSRDLHAQANADLRAMWNMAIGDLVERNPLFGEVWSRYFADRQVLTLGSN